MPHERNYTCARRYLGICGGDPECADDAFNVLCENYIPCHVIGFTAVIYPPEEARRIKSELQAKLNASRNPKPLPSADIDSGLMTGPTLE